MSSSFPSGGDGTPRSFPEVTPTSDLGGHRGGIAFMLGELTAQVKHLSEDVRAQTGRIDKLRDDVTSDIKEQKLQVKAIADKVLIAETQVSSAFYTSKLFIAAASAALGLLAGNWKWVVRLVGDAD